MKRIYFTLVELLVVIAIIAVLASLLLPALGTARSTAKSISCVGNLRTIASSVYMYTSDYSGYLPLGLCRTSATLTMQNWAWTDQVALYCTKFKTLDESRQNSSNMQFPFSRDRALLNIKIFSCPGNPIQTAYDKAPGLIYFSGNYNANGGSDGLFVTFDIPSGSMPDNSKIEKFLYLSNTGMCWDGCGPYTNSALANRNYYVEIGGSYCIATQPHNNYANILYADSHVKAGQRGHPYLPMQTNGSRLFDQK